MTKTLRILFFIQFFVLFSGGLLNPVYTAYVGKIGGNLFTAGSAMATELAVIGILIFISGKIAGRFHTEKLQLLIGYSIGLGVMIGYLLITTPKELFILQLILGLSVAVAQPAYNGLFSQGLGSANHTSQWGTYLAMTYVAVALAAFVSGFLSQVYGFTTLFSVMILTQSIGVVGAFYLNLIRD